MDYSQILNKDKKDLINLLDFKSDIYLAYLEWCNEQPSGEGKLNTPRCATAKILDLTWEAIIFSNSKSSNDVKTIHVMGNWRQIIKCLHLYLSSICAGLDQGFCIPHYLATAFAAAGAGDQRKHCRSIPTSPYQVA